MADKRIEIRYRPQGPVLERYIAGQARREFIMGPLGSGKTNASCWKAFRIMTHQAPNSQGVRKSRLYAVRNTYPDLMGTTVKDWLDMFGDGLGKFVQGSLEPPTHYLDFNLPDGTKVQSELVFVALDRAEHIRKLRGSQLTAAWLNEVKELNKAVLDMIDLRVGRYPSAADGGPSWYGVFGDTNAPDEDHWYYKLAEEDKPEGYVFHRQPGGVIQVGSGDTATWRENDKAENIQNLPKGYYANGVQGKSQDWIKVNLANEYGFVQDGRPVYPEYRDMVHCREFEFTKEAGLWIGLDFGLTPAAVFGQRLVNGQWRWHRELVTTDTGIITFAGLLKQEIATHYNGVKILGITGDPAGTQRQGGDENTRTVFQILQAQKVDAYPAHSNAFNKRREAVAAGLTRMIDGAPGLLVHPQCKTLRKGMAGAYNFKRVQVSGDERYKDEPDKNSYSHPCFVAGTLIDTPTGPLAIETLRVGDLVSTPIGPRRIVFAANRPSNVLEINTTAGSIVCTPDHPIYTQRCFVRAEALQYSDIIGDRSIVWKFLFRLQRYVVGPSGLYSLSTASGTTFARAITRQRTENTCIEPSGERTSGQSLKGGKFTIGTTTARTTIQAILSAWTATIMRACTVLKKVARRMVGERSLLREQPLLSGAGLTLDSHPRSVARAAQAQQPSSQQLARLNYRVLTAASSISDMRTSSKKASAACRAKAWLAKTLALITLDAIALCVGQCSAAISTLVGRPVRLLAKGEQYPSRVYNIEVEDAHAYYANGLLVSNCEAAQYLMMGAGEGRAVVTAEYDGPVPTVCITEYSMFN